jgi:serine/threonine protein kinase/Tol biopolymer transport system component
MAKLTLIESVFLAALEKRTPEERTVYLDEACASDAALRKGVEHLLKAHAEAGSFLEKPVEARAATQAYTPLPSPGHEDPASDVSPPGSGVGKEEPAQPERPGTRIGPYKLLQQIGEGGMGVVWMAEQQEPVRRMVAVKVIKAGMDSAQVIARFEAERQALALMDHPNIAKVLDAGTIGSALPPPARGAGGEGLGGEGTGRPYFVMELVKGIPLTKYCDEHRLTPRQRLELFMPVCHALQHAHQKGIIHRDIKPSNVLVAPYDGEPVVKVIDFGVAKATGQRLTERTMFTEFGAVIGTLEYMSPEQAELNNQDIDTRSDIYSLGVLLYELLTGTTPLDRAWLKKAAFTEALRLIREVDPPKPSTRLSESRELLPAISAQRHTEPAKLTKLIRGELDWIVMKALDKERGRRYETANGLARDIERYLHEETVEACPPSAAYRLRKSLRRNKGLVTAIAAVLMTLLLGMALSIVLAVRATHAENDALLAQDKAQVAQQEAVDQGNEAGKQRDEARQANRNLSDAKEELRSRLYATQMNLTQSEWDKDNVTRVRDLLHQLIPKPGDKDLRGFEWYYWDRLSHAELWTIDFGSALVAKEFSADGSLFAALVRLDTGPPNNGNSNLAEIRIVDTVSGQQRIKFPVPGDFGQGRDLAFSPDGQRVAVANKKGVTVWDAGTGQQLFAVKTPVEITELAFDGAGSRLAAAIGIGEIGGSDLHAIKVWNAHTGEELANCQMPTNGGSHCRFAGNIAFSPDGNHLAAVMFAPLDCTITVWDAGTGKPVTRIELAGTFSALLGVLRTPMNQGTLNFSSDGKRLALPFQLNEGKHFNMGAIGIWDAETGKAMLTIKGLPAGRVNAGFDASGKKLFGVDGLSGDVNVWDADTGETRLSIFNSARAVPAIGSESPGQLAEVRTGFEFGAVHSPDGKSFTVKGGRTVQVRDAVSGEVRLDLKGHSGAVTHIAFSKDQRRIFSAAADGTLKAWDASPGVLWRGFQHDFNNSQGIIFSPDGRRAAEVGVDPGVRFRNPAPDEVLDVVATLRVWDTADWKELVSIKRDDLVYMYLRVSVGRQLSFARLDFSSDGKRLLIHQFPHTSRENKPLRPVVLDTGTGKELPSFETALQWGARSILSPDRTRLASWGEPKSKEQLAIKVWDAKSNSELFVLSMNGDVDIWGFSPDGSRLVVSTTTNKKETHASDIKMYDGWTGKELASIRVPGGIIRGVISPDGQTLAIKHAAEQAWKLWGTWGPDLVGGVSLWDVTSGRQRAQLIDDPVQLFLMAFNPDGSRLVTVGRDWGPGSPGNVVKIWDTATGTELLRLTTEIVRPTNIAFSHGGARLMVAGYPANLQGPDVVQVWDAIRR